MIGRGSTHAGPPAPPAAAAIRPLPVPAAAVVGAASGCAAAVGVAAAWNLATAVQMASWIVAGFLAVPLLLTVVGISVALSLTAIAGALALPSCLRGRATGLRDLVGEAFALPLAILPRYAAALRRARRPFAFGMAFGFAAGALLLLAVGAPGA